MIAESGLCLALDKKKLQEGGKVFNLVQGGIVTPASSMGHVLLDRLRAAEMIFDLVIVD
jgi:short subunit dehydrogenase-like uncharacterized protein